MPAIAEVRIPITLDRERELIFNFNTYSEFEAVTARDGNPQFYFDVMLKLEELFEKVRQSNEPVDESRLDADPEKRAAQIRDIQGRRFLAAVRQAPTSDLRNMIWAALHEYDKHGEVVHPLTRNQIGRCLGLLDIPRLVGMVLRGHLANSPNKAELGEAAGAGNQQPAATPPVANEPQASTQPENGGAPSTVLHAEDFA